MTPESPYFLNRKAGLYLDHTETKGRGLFCITDIAADEELEATPAIILNEEETDRIDSTTLLNYVFSTGAISKALKQQAGIRKLDETSCVVMGIASYCNHDEHPNAEVVWEEQDGTLYYVLRATRAIPAHTEICTSYGETWFSERDF